MEVENYPKWKDTTIGADPFFISMIMGGRKSRCPMSGAWPGGHIFSILPQWSATFRGFFIVSPEPSC